MPFVSPCVPSEYNGKEKEHEQNVCLRVYKKAKERSRGRMCKQNVCKSEKERKQDLVCTCEKERERDRDNESNKVCMCVSKIETETDAETDTSARACVREIVGYRDRM